MAKFTRIYRRFIIRNFGGTKNCLTFFLALLVTIYVVDQFLFPKQKLLSFTGKSQNADEVKPKADEAKPKADEAKPKADEAKPKVDEAKPKADNVPPKLNVSPVSPVIKPVIPQAAEKPAEAKNQKPAEPVNRQCGPTASCPEGKFTYYLKSGVDRDGLPTICFNGRTIVSHEKGNAGRGFNIVVINDKTLEVEDVRTFDVYVGDAVFRRYLKLGIQDGHFFLAATLDEASYNLGDESRGLLKRFGSNLIDKLKFRDNFVVIGQKGLVSGNAIEKHLARDQGKDFGESVEITGCLSVPMGKLEQIQLSEKEQREAAEAAMDVHMGEAQENCGVAAPCGESEFSAHMYTGRENKDMTKLCINGKYVFGQGLNDAGRGLNIAIINPSTKEVYRIGRFDTFEADTSNLEIFLEMVNENDIIIVISHDEASTNVNLNIQSELQSLGSQFINKLSFRDAWVFVGQRGMVGKSPIEQISYAGEGWPRPIDKKLCIPTVLKGVAVNSSTSDSKKLLFCRKYRDNSEFCSGTRTDLSLLPTPLKDKGLATNEIFQVPVVIIPRPAGCLYSVLQSQLEAVLLIPGLIPKLVTVFYTQATHDCGELADVFNFKTIQLDTNTTSYPDFLQMALEKAWSIHSTAHYLIVLEEDVIPSPDLLSFFSQCLPVLRQDDSLVGVTAWNENGYDGVSTRPDLVYRVETFPGIGFLLKKSFYDEAMKGLTKECCSSRSWQGWLNDKRGEKEMLVPDVSRAFRKELKATNITEELFGRKRITSLEDVSQIADVSKLMKSSYEDELHKLIESSLALDSGESAKCLSGRELGFKIPDTEEKVYSIYYEQKDLKDQATLSLLAKCFQLFSLKGQSVRGLHRGLLRFTYKKNIVFLIGSATDYYKHKPTNHKPVSA